MKITRGMWVVGYKGFIWTWPLHHDFDTSDILDDLPNKRMETYDLKEKGISKYDDK